MKHIASISWGKDSLGMLLMLIEKGYPLDEVVFYDTGVEFQAIYDTRDKVLPVLESNGIKYTQLSPYYSFEYKMFDKPVNRGKANFHYGYSWCGGVCRWGTADKNNTIDKYCGENIVYVGLAHDEIDRIKKERKPNKRLPLVDWKISEKMALVYCYQHGYWWYEGDTPLYSVLDRASCWCCANKNLKELRGYYNYLPRYWERLKCLQSRTNRPMKGYYDKDKTKPRGVFELEEHFKTESKEENV